ncbi:MAG: rod shape-determining protein RodA [Gammaproteobacteria bacterium]
MSGWDFSRSVPWGRRERGMNAAWLRVDATLLLLLLILMGIGLVTLYSASGGSQRIVLRQAVHFGMGLAVMLLCAQIPPAFYQRWTPLVYCVGLCLLVAVLFVGVGANGAQRWLGLPGLPRFQPSEIMKLAVPMMAAWYLADTILPPPRKRVVAVIMLVFLPGVLIARQPDLGTALLITTSGMLVLLLAGMHWKYLVSAAVVSVPASLALWTFYMHDYQRKRVLTFLNPEREPLASGWNIIQSKIAIGSGGLSGKGYQHGTQSQLDFLPESSTDFIIAVFTEEFGFKGALVLLALYVLLVLRGLYIAAQAQDTFSRLLAGALTLIFFVYVFVNIGMVSGILPIVGVPLPLVSYGGTSVVTLLAGFGILMSVHTHRRLLVGL